MGCRRKTVSRTVDSNRYVIYDKSTGAEVEVNKGVNVYALHMSDDVVYDSKDYSYLDNNALVNLIHYGMKHHELGVLIMMSTNFMPHLNVCLDAKGYPFTTKSLSLLLKKTPQNTKSILNNLIKKGAIYYGFIPNAIHLGKVYVVNPQLLRKGKTFSGELPKLFKGFFEERLVFKVSNKGSC